MLLTARWWLATAFVLAATPTYAKNPEPTKEQCIASNERGAALRRQARLLDADAEFRRCEAKSCPGPIKDDCSQQRRDVETAIPTVAVRVVAADGEAIGIPTLKLDGSLFDQWENGTPIQLDPGAHVVGVEAPGFASVTRTLRLIPGAKESELIALDRITSASPSANEGTYGAWQTQRSVALGLAALSLISLGIGSYYGLHAKSVYDDGLTSECRGNPHRCSPAGVGRVDDAHRDAAVSTISFVTAIALIAGGALLYLRSPSASSTQRTYVTIPHRTSRRMCLTDKERPL